MNRHLPRDTRHMSTVSEAGTITFDHCPGCEGKVEEFKHKGDHKHQFIGYFGNTVTVWFIDGTAYTIISDVSKYLKETYELTTEEQLRFLSDLEFEVN